MPFAATGDYSHDSATSYIEAFFSHKIIANHYLHKQLNEINTLRPLQVLIKMVCGDQLLFANSGFGVSTYQVLPKRVENQLK